MNITTHGPLEPPGYSYQSLAFREPRQSKRKWPKPTCNTRPRIICRSESAWGRQWQYNRLRNTVLAVLRLGAGFIISLLHLWSYALKSLVSKETWTWILLLGPTWGLPLEKQLTYWKLFLSLYVYGVLPAYICMPVVPSALGRQKRVLGPRELGLKDGCEQPRRCWELNLGHVEEQPVLLSTEPSL